MNQKITLIAIAIGFLVAAWSDGRDADLAEKYAASVAGQQLACIADTDGACR